MDQDRRARGFISSKETLKPDPSKIETDSNKLDVNQPRSYFPETDKLSQNPFLYNILHISDNVLTS